MKEKLSYCQGVKDKLTSELQAKLYTVMVITFFSSREKEGFLLVYIFNKINGSIKNQI